MSWAAALQWYSLSFWFDDSPSLFGLWFSQGSFWGIQVRGESLVSAPVLAACGVQSSMGRT
jgi:hypothetical protein